MRKESLTPTIFKSLKFAFRGAPLLFVPKFSCQRGMIKLTFSSQVDLFCPLFVLTQNCQGRRLMMGKFLSFGDLNLFKFQLPALFGNFSATCAWTTSTFQSADYDDDDDDIHGS